MMTIIKGKYRLNYLISSLILAALLGLFYFNIIYLPINRLFTLFFGLLICGILFFLSQPQILILSDIGITSQYTMFRITKTIPWHEIEEIREREVDSRSSPLVFLLLLAVLFAASLLLYGAKYRVLEIIALEGYTITLDSRYFNHFDATVEEIETLAAQHQL